MNKILASIIALLAFTGAQASGFPPNIEANQKTIQALIDAGSNPNKPHPLEYHFYCYSKGCLNSLMTKGKLLGYKVANTGESTHDGNHYWYGDLIKETVLNLDIVNKENSIMLKLANQFDVEYDGWGTPVVE